MTTFTQKEQERVGALLTEDPSAGRAEWAGKCANSALSWNRDGELYSASGAIVKLLQASRARPHDDGGSPNGPTHWEVEGDVCTLWEMVEALSDLTAGPAADEEEGLCGAPDLEAKVAG